MEIIQDVLTESDFAKELINRFFNPRSYFFYCVSHHLDCLLDRNDNTNNNAYLVFGNLMDRLVNADDKFHELQQLAKIDGFNQFYEKLDEAVKYLGEKDLDPEQMKIVIENLANLLVKTSLQVIYDENERANFDTYLGLDRFEMAAEFQEAAMQVSESKVHSENHTDHIQTQNGSARSEYSEIIPENTEPPSEAFGNNGEGEANRPASFPELANGEDMDVLQSPQDREAEMPDVADFFKAEEGGSENRTDTFPTAAGKNAAVNFKGEISARVGMLLQIFEKLKQEPKHQKTWKKGRQLFGEIEEISMIYGLVDLEQIALRAQDVFAIAKQDRAKYAPAAVELLFETTQVCQSLNDTDYHELHEEALADLVSRLRDADATIHAMSAQPEPQTLKTLQPEPTTTPKKETKTVEEPEQDAVPEAEQDALPPAGEDAVSGAGQDAVIEPRLDAATEDLSYLLHDEPNGESPNGESPNGESTEEKVGTGGFKLPGEDDEEIKALFKEISSNRSSLLDKEEVEFDINDEFEALPLEKLEIDGQEDPSQNVETNGASDELRDFRKECELYFTIIEDALDTLKKQPQNRRALEDLELTSCSIHGLCHKMNLEPLARIPEAIETLVSNIIKKEAYLIERAQTAIRGAFDHLKDLKDIEDTEKKEYKEYVSLIQDLNYSLHGHPGR